MINFLKIAFVLIILYIWYSIYHEAKTLVEVNQNQQENILKNIK